jgi:hypothetical protein
MKKALLIFFPLVVFVSDTTRLNAYPSIVATTTPAISLIVKGGLYPRPGKARSVRQRLWQKRHREAHGEYCKCEYGYLTESESREIQRNRVDAFWSSIGRFLFNFAFYIGLFLFLIYGVTISADRVKLKGPLRYILSGTLFVIATAGYFYFLDVPRSVIYGALVVVVWVGIIFLVQFGTRKDKRAYQKDDINQR